MTEQGELLLYREVAKLLRCSERHLRDCYVKTRILPTVYVGPRAPRFRREDVDALIRRLMELQKEGVANA